MARVTRSNIDHSKIRRAMDNPRTEAVLLSKIVLIKGTAITVFLSQVKHTDGVTPPPYVTMFHINRIRMRGFAGYRLSNNDPASFWVEYGAYLPQNAPFEHPNERHPQILKYRPLRRAIDIVGTGQ